MANDKKTKKPAVTKVEPPIKDLDGNQQLGSKEIRKQLDAEHKELFEASVPLPPGRDRVRGVLGVFGMREHADRYFEALIKVLRPANEQAAPVNDLERDRAALREKIVDDAKDIGAVERAGAQTIKDALSDDARFLFSKDNKPVMSDYRRSLMQTERRIDRQERYDADVANAKAYVDTFKRTFRKGINIAPEDTTAIMEHFVSPGLKMQYDIARNKEKAARE